MARAGGEGDSALRRQRHLPDRLVAAGAGRAHRQVPARRAAAAAIARGQRHHGRLHGPADAARRAGGRAEAEAARRGGRADPRPVRARLGAARAQRRLRHRRRHAARAGGRERRRLGRGLRPAAVHAGRADHRQGAWPRSTPER